MHSHMVDLYCFPHALLNNVLMPHAVSDHTTGNLVENAIKHSIAPPAENFKEAIRHFSLGEQNYLMACYIAWIDESAYDAAVASGKLPAELHLAWPLGSASGPIIGDVEDHYDTYCYTPKQWRQRALELRIENMNTEKRDLQGQLKRLTAKPKA